MQFGGDDQWSNMLGGTELIRRKLGKDAYAMTITLLLNSEGKKMGKTENGAVWLDAEKTSPYDFFQYWRNVGDADVIKCMKMLTFMSLDEIAEYEKLEGSELNKAKEKLAYELTELVHGKEEAEKALEAARNIFSGAGVSANMPTTAITDDDFTDGKITLSAILVKCGMCASNGDAKRSIKEGGISVNDVKITDFAKAFNKKELDGETIIKKGKKNFHKVVLG